MEKVGLNEDGAQLLKKLRCEAFVFRGTHLWFALGTDAIPLRMGQRKVPEFLFFSRWYQRLSANQTPDGSFGEELLATAPFQFHVWWSRGKVKSPLTPLKPRSLTSSAPGRVALGLLLILHYSGFSHAEIGEAAGLNPTSIGTLLSRAERDFKERFLKMTKGARP